MSKILQFPHRNKGRVRKSGSMQAAGRLSLSIMERDGEDVPANVTDIRATVLEAEVDYGRCALRLAAYVFRQLPEKKQQRLRDALLWTSREGDDQVAADSAFLRQYLEPRKSPTC